MTTNPHPNSSSYISASGWVSQISDHTIQDHVYLDNATSVKFAKRKMLHNQHNQTSHETDVQMYGDATAI